jgi:hypothetical protein
MLLAAKLAEGTLTLGEAFTFMSGLYFRGKMAYVQAFCEAPGSTLVITPTRGLLPPDTVVSAKLLREFARVDVAAEDARYRRPLLRSLRELTATLPAESRVVLLGSIATGKYVDVLTRSLGHRLHFPSDFIGRGDMSRGGLMLRAAASRVELPYSVLTPGVQRHGIRPPKLAPLPPSART